MPAPRVARPPATDPARPGGPADPAPLDVSAAMRAQFIALSVQLTGFDRVRLLGTGMADEYARVLASALPAGVQADLLAASGDALDEARVGAILRDPKLGPVARNLVILWYCGTWAPLPAAWQQAYGTAAAAPSGVVSAQAYQQGLQWVAAGAHPMGARQQGYGAWAEPPSEVAQ
jgi:hypothetical protein